MKITRLKLVGYVLLGLGMLVGNAIQKREIEEAVEEALDEREKNQIEAARKSR